MEIRGAFLLKSMSPTWGWGIWKVPGNVISNCVMSSMFLLDLERLHSAKANCRNA